MTKDEIRAGIAEMMTIKDAFKEAEDRYFRIDGQVRETVGGLRKRLVAQFGTGYFRLDGVTYKCTEEFLFPITVMDLDGLPDVYASNDRRCVKSINPRLDPADLSAIWNDPAEEAS